jgi:hypothetical protein
MEIYRSSVFANQLKTLLKTDWDKFQELLCDELENNPPKMPEIMSEVRELCDSQTAMQYYKNIY